MSEKFYESLVELEEARAALRKDPTNKLIQDATCKRFEVAMEYAWKAMKKVAESDGIELYSPKDAIRAAAKLQLIDVPEVWITFINARNFAVHDYFGIDSDEQTRLVDNFLKEGKQLAARLRVR
jgi:nucleotidyltransferase substrate binding protein (TIGR01987 family)